MGPAASVGRMPPNVPTPTDMYPIPTAPPVDLLGMIPTDLHFNTAVMEVPARRLLNPDQGWLTLGTAQPPGFPAGPDIIHAMEHSAQWRSRAKIPTPAEIIPVIKHRRASSMPECETDIPIDEWALKKLGVSLTCMAKTGPSKDIPVPIAALAALRELNTTKGSAGRPSALISLGGPMVRVDYSSQMVSV